MATVTITQPTAEVAAPPAPATSHLDHILYLFGFPIAHSLSPLFHGTVYRSLGLKYEQHLYETPSLAACLTVTKDPKFLGASVTMPFKVAIIPFLDSLTDEGKAIGAINTIYWRTSPEGKRILCGTNTDCIGIQQAILRNASPESLARIKGRPGMVIGGGGTSRAAVYALRKFLGCSDIYLVNRDASEVSAVVNECVAAGIAPAESLHHISTVSEAQQFAAPGVIVSAIPDFSPKTETEVRTRAVIDVLLSKEEGKGPLLEMCYHPSPETGIKSLALERGWAVIPGVEAMVWQGFEQDHVWLGREVELPVEEVRAVINRKLAETKH